ncbi:AAA family ATPase [Chloroflexi bacterium TSY]|nr:AAA family ATPase [Chloroflexi bacterium TSY]
MAIRIDAQEFREILRLTPPEQNIMLIGKHGIGKSEIITEFYRQQKMRVVAFFLGQMSDPGDLIGLMNKDESSGRSVFLPPYWWPKEDEPIVLFLDELNRARPEILQAVMDLTLNKTLAGKRLPTGSIVISAVNEGEEYQLTDLDPALVSRFNLYEFAPTVEDWLLWAGNHDVDPRIITFIQKSPHHLDGEGVQIEESLVAAGLIKVPDRRAWVKVSYFVTPLERLEDIHVKSIAGIVGSQAAIAFQQSLAEAAKVTPEQILLRFSRHKAKLKEMSIQELILLNEQLMLWINGQKYQEKNEEKIRGNLFAYLKELQQLKQNEAVAHLASLIENPRYEQATGVLAQSLELINFLTDYVQGIEI